MSVVRFLSLLFFIVFIPLFGTAQIKQPVKWDFSWVRANNQEVLITFTATMEEGWHVYSQFLEEGGPVPTSFIFVQSDDYVLVDHVEEVTEAIEIRDQTFGMPVAWFEKSADFIQRVKLNKSSAIIKGKVRFMACSEMQCLSPDERKFAIEVKLGQAEKKATIKKTALTIPSEESTILLNKVDTLLVDSVSPKKIESNKSTSEIELKQANQYSGWSVFLLGFLGGLIALLMPCIFPMIPFTISYFLRSEGSHKKQVGKAFLYGISIIVIYVGLGITITLLFGADALNALSTGGVVNFGLFLLLIIFAASLLGGFEITLPSSWINKADAQSGRKGFAGIFFMAATLALVSFSCTGPIIGTLLVKTFEMGSISGPALGMLGFSLALAAPFTLFAMFPAWLKMLPKSGGWLNSVKVVLGLMELALALKFLSNVDLVYHWRWFDREVFLVLWIIIFALTGFYLLGKIRFPHDSELKVVSPFRLFLAIISLAFTLYMVPGLWGAPLKAISAFLPPQQTQDFDLYSASLPATSASRTARPPRKYSELFEAPLNLEAFFDVEEGLNYARKVNKPVLIDFTGHACVNCRKMEATVWPDPAVLNFLQNDFVVVQLYVDDKTSLPENEQAISSFSGKKLKTIGNKWSDFQAVSFNTNSQPYYVILDPDGRQLVDPRGANYDPHEFSAFLKKGVMAFENQLMN